MDTPADHDPRDQSVGVRELRQNLSVYLRRIRAGESFTVTERGTPVARLAALPPTTSLMDRLVAEGKLRAPTVPGGVTGLRPGVPAEPGGPTSDQILDDLREDVV